MEKIDENPEIQTILETYESMSTSEQNLDIPVPEMMKQLIEVTEIISQDRIQQCTLEQISDTSVSQAVKELDTSTTIRRHCGNESRCDRQDEKHWKGNFLSLMTRLHRCQWNGYRSRVPSPIW